MTDFEHCLVSAVEKIGEQFSLCQAQSTPKVVFQEMTKVFQVNLHN